MFSALAVPGAVTPTVGTKSLSFTVSEPSPLTPPDWMLEHSTVTAAPLVRMAGLASLVKTLRARSAGALWRSIDTPPTWSNWLSVIVSVDPLLVLSMASRPIRLNATFVTDTADPLTTIAFFSMSRMAPFANCSGPATVRPSSKLIDVLLVSTAAPLTLMPAQSPLAGGGQGANGEGF